MPKLYEIVRAGRYYLVREIATGALIQTRTKAEAETWIRKAELAAVEAAEWAATVRAARVERVRAYLARRAARPQQLKLF